MPVATRRVSGAAKPGIWLLTLAVVLSCNEYPVHSLLDTFEVRVTSRLAHDEPVKLDFLWVIDHSTSMCQEQRALAAGFQEFIAALTRRGSIDGHMAVTTVQQAPAAAYTPGGAEVDGRIPGRFVHKAAKVFPANCMEQLRMPCLGNAHCNNGVTAFSHTHDPADTSNYTATMCSPNTFAVPPAVASANGTGLGDWTCSKPTVAAPVPGQPPADPRISNLNCSLNSTCRARCKLHRKHEDCVQLFGSGAKCTSTGGGVGSDQAGCMFPPATAGCPAEDALPPVLRHDELEAMFRCNATVGTASTNEAGFEGGFRAAWLALDPDGPNCDYDACLKSLRACCEDGAAWCKSDINAARCKVDRQSLCEPLKNPAGPGPNPDTCQPRRLVRDDAFLVIVFVSDDDDCSMRLDLHPLDTHVIIKETWDRCQVLGDAIAGNAALNEGACEYYRLKNADVVCPSDCLPGSTTARKDGQPKCPKGCKVTCDDGCVGDAEIMKLVTAGDWQACPVHCRTDSDERKSCLLAASGSMVKFQKGGAHPKAGWQFAPVADFVKRFKGLKADPAKVLVAAISGDAMKPAGWPQAKPYTQAQKHRDRVKFYHSALADAKPGQAPYICAGARGEAGYGGRYLQLVEAFRDNGVFHNICAGQDFTPALVNIADTLLKNVTRVCLPQPPLSDPLTGQPDIKVVRTNVDGSKEKLTLTASCAAKGDHAKTSFCIRPSADCRVGKADLVGKNAACKTNRECTAGLTCVNDGCQVYSDAVFFPVVQEPGVEIEVNYAADLGF